MFGAGFVFLWARPGVAGRDRVGLTLCLIIFFNHYDDKSDEYLLCLLPYPLGQFFSPGLSWKSSGGLSER